MFPVVSFDSGARNTNHVRLVSNGQLISHVTGSSKLLVPGRVTAATSIPQGAMSVAIEPNHLRGQPDIVQISVKANSYGTIELENKSQEIWCKDIHWIRALRLSDDCHSYNIQLRLHPTQKPCSNLNKNLPTPQLILQSVKPIAAGEELLLWFSEDILAMLQIAFLTPANIQGQKKYICTRCSALYESPNPLKLHISLGCGRQSITTMWNKLAHVLAEYPAKRVATHKEPPGFNFTLISDTPFARQKTAIDLSKTQIKAKETSPPGSVAHNLYRPYSEPSAFKPFIKDETQSDNNNSIKPSKLLPAVTNVMSSWQLPAFTHQQYNDEAHIETLVSSLGKSKQGHICLYCGKCYSRKYGLKIHIRTHTGYKPLKCKFCMRPFGDPSNLNKHIRLHAEGDTPYKCGLCGKVLVRRRDLERHLKSRHMTDMHPGSNVIEDSHNEETHTSEEETEKCISLAS